MAKITDEEALRRQLVRWLAERDQLRARLVDLDDHIQEIENWLKQQSEKS